MGWLDWSRCFLLKTAGISVIVVYFNSHSYLNRLKKKEEKDVFGKYDA